jgi:hypothetical protein
MPLLFSSSLEQQKQQQQEQMQQRLQRRRASESTHLLSKSVNASSLLSSQHASSKYLNYKNLNVKRNSLFSPNSSSNINQLLPPYSSLASLSNENNNNNNNAKLNFNNSDFSLNEEDSFCPINLNNNPNINNNLSISFINNDLSQPIIKELTNNNGSYHGSASNSVSTSITNLNHSIGTNLNKNSSTNATILSNNNISNSNVASANNTPRFSVNFPSQSKTTNSTQKQTSNFFSQLSSKRRSSIAVLPSTSNSYNFNINRDIQNTTPTIYTNTSLNLSQPSTAFSSSIYNNNFNKTNNKEELMNRNKPSNFPILQPKRKKSNSLSIIDYANILSMNTNYQMLADFYDDTEVSMARLSLKTTRNANIQKQASLSEQMAALFGSSMCDCILCKLKTVDAKRAQQHNFEIVHNKHNADFSIAKFTYSTPFSQLSSLKLFNLMNTDVSIVINNNNNNENCSSSNSSKFAILFERF